MPAGAPVEARFSNAISIYTYQTLHTATGGFDRTRLLGEGGYGEVFEANMPNGTVVAVKRMAPDAQDGEAGFLAEVSSTGSVSHGNVLPVLGVAVDQPRRCLVYPIMRGGSVADRLSPWRGLPQLTAPQRIQVAAGAAHGLAALHEKGIIHRDMKTSNILLDDVLAPKVSDLGLCRRLAPLETHARTRRMGTDGYIDPEYSETMELREQSDVYSFGVVLLELISGQPAYDEKRSPPGLVGRFRQHLRAGKPAVDFADMTVGFTESLAEAFARIAEDCIRLPGDGRPKAHQVAKRLDDLAAVANRGEGGAGGPSAATPAQPAAARGAAAPAPDRASGEATASQCTPSGSQIGRDILQMARNADEKIKADIRAAAAGGLSAVAKIRDATTWSLDKLVESVKTATPEAIIARSGLAVRGGEAGGVGCTAPLLTLILSADDSFEVCPGETLGIDHVISALRARAGPEGTPGRSALLALADSADSQVQAATAGSVDAIVQAMRAHEKRAPVQEWAVWALKEMAVKSAANRALIGRSSGAVSATVAAMKSHSAAVGVQDHSCRLVAVLSQGDAENTGRAVEEGAVDAVINAVVLHPLAQSVQTHGFAALAAMAAASDAGLERVRAARCITTVLEGIERFPNHRGVQAQGRLLLEILGPDMSPAAMAVARARAAAAAAAIDQA